MWVIVLGIILLSLACIVGIGLLLYYQAKKGGVARAIVSPASIVEMTTKYVALPQTDGGVSYV